MNLINKHNYTKPKLVIGLFILEKLTYFLSFIKRGLVENPIPDTFGKTNSIALFPLFFFFLITAVFPQSVPFISINGKINNSSLTKNIYNTSDFVPFKKNNNALVLDSLIYVFSSGAKGRRVYFYNEGNSLHYFTSASWSNNAWSVSEKHTNTYNDDGNLESVLWERFVMQEWEKDSKDIYSYDSSGNRVSHLRQYFTGKWFENAFKSEYYYNGTNLVTTLYQKWLDTNWVNSSKTIDTYTSDNLRDSSLFQEWENNQWINYQLNIFDYDENLNIISNEVKRWQENQWADHASGEFQYDVNNNLLLENWKIAQNNNWENWLRIFYEYDDNNNLIYLMGEEWENNRWVSKDEPLLVTNPDGILYGYLAKEVLLFYSNPTSVKSKKNIADEFNLFQNYPNPFNPSTTISYSLPSASNVKLEIYDVMGRMIKSFTANSQSSGKHQVVWDGTNSNGVRVSSGIYIYRFEAASLENNERFVKSNKLILLR